MKKYKKIKVRKVCVGEILHRDTDNYWRIVKRAGNQYTIFGMIGDHYGETFERTIRDFRERYKQIRCTCGLPVRWLGAEEMSDDFKCWSCCR